MALTSSKSTRSGTGTLGWQIRDMQPLSSYTGWLPDELSFVYRDNFLILQCMIGALACLIFPSLQSLPRWDLMGLLTALLLHVVFSEPVFYCLHRVLHRPQLFQNYHSLHHSSQVPQSFTGNTARISSRFSDNPCTMNYKLMICSVFSWICHAFGAPHPVCGHGSPSSRSLLGWTWLCWAHIWLCVAV